MSNFSGDITLVFSGKAAAQEAFEHLEEFLLARIFGWQGAAATDITEPEQIKPGSTLYQFQVFFTADEPPCAALLAKFLAFGGLSEIQFWWTDSDLYIREELRYAWRSEIAGHNPIPVEHYYYRANSKASGEYELEDLYQRHRSYEQLWVTRPENGTPTIGSILNSIKRHRRLL